MHPFPQQMTRQATGDGVEKRKSQRQCRGAEVHAQDCVLFEISLLCEM